jgi:arylsulfatase A-like enzyme
VTRPNILFLSIEDLNDWIAPLGGHPDTITPNLTRLARHSVVFERAYAAAPACSPSRAATLYGRNPWETGIYGNAHRPNHAFPRGRGLSLVGGLQSAGYQTFGAGKVFHVLKGQFDHDEWTEYHGQEPDSFAPISRSQKSGALGSNSDFGPAPDDTPQYDELNTDWITRRMTGGAEGQFWALGLYRPHLPFIVPKRFFDQLPAAVADPPGLGANGFAPDNAAPLAGLPRPAMSFVRQNAGLGKALHAHGEYKAFLKAYLASISYADALLGRVMDRMDEQGLWGNTIVVLWSDHGWQLGEKLAFRKFTLWERALRVPLFIGGPGIAPGRAGDPVSLTDIAPTLFSLAGLPAPGRFTGQDMAPLLRGEAQALRGHALSVWGHDLMSDRPKLAFSARSRDFRFIRYWTGHEELYDHRADPFEHANLLQARDDGALAAVVRAHRAMLPVAPCPPVNTAPPRRRWQAARKMSPAQSTTTSSGGKPLKPTDE